MTMSWMISNQEKDEVGDEVGDEGVVVAHNEEEEKEDGLPEAEDREKDMPEEDVLEWC